MFNIVTSFLIVHFVLKVVVSLVRQLHARDNRRPFCPEDHWISKQVQIIYQPSELPFRKRRLRGYRPFHGLRALSREELGKLTLYYKYFLI